MPAFRINKQTTTLMTAVVFTVLACQTNDKLPPRGTLTSSSAAASSSSGDGGSGGMGGQGAGGSMAGGMGGGGGMPPAPFCGDDSVNGTEECDDGNTNSGDGCASDCTIESSESEPNDTAATASSYMPNPFYLAKITQSDVDFVAFSVTVPNASVIARIIDVGNGACAKGEIDSFIDILAADGSTVLASDDDGDEGFCSRATAPSLAMGDYFVRIAAAPKSMFQSFIYRLRIDQIEDACGDGMVTPGEECDDGNVLPGDGCSPTCKIEVNEVEPNGTPATANSFVPPWNAVLDPAGDVDVVTVILASPAVTFTATTTDQGTGACGAKTLDTIVEILAPDGTTVLASGDDIVGNCGSALATNVAAGTYYVRVKGGSLATYPSAYGLQIILQ